MFALTLILLARYLGPNIVLRADVSLPDLQSLQGYSRSLLVTPAVETAISATAHIFARFGFVAISRVHGTTSCVVEYPDIQSVSSRYDFFLFTLLLFPGDASFIRHQGKFSTSI